MTEAAYTDEELQGLRDAQGWSGSSGDWVSPRWLATLDAQMAKASAAHADAERELRAELEKMRREMQDRSVDAAVALLDAYKQRDTALARVVELETAVTSYNAFSHDADMTIVTLSTERDEALRKLEAVSVACRELDSDRDHLRGQLRAVNIGIEGVWRYQGDGDDKLETLSCPVVMRPDTLKAILDERDEARRIAGVGALANDNDWQEKYAVISDKCVADRAVLSALVAALPKCKCGKIALKQFLNEPPRCDIHGVRGRPIGTTGFWITSNDEPDLSYAVPLRNAIALLAGQPGATDSDIAAHEALMDEEQRQLRAGIDAEYEANRAVYDLQAYDVPLTSPPDPLDAVRAHGSALRTKLQLGAEATAEVLASPPDPKLVEAMRLLTEAHHHAMATLLMCRGGADMGPALRPLVDESIRLMRLAKPSAFLNASDGGEKAEP